MSDFSLRPPGSPGSSAGELDALRAKYAEIRRLRLAGESAAAARPALARLARHYPGALRELDALPMNTIEERLSALDRAIHGRTTPEPWMAAQAEYHSLARGALAAKRWLGRDRKVDAATVERFVAHARTRTATTATATTRANELLAWANDLETVARPPEGRLTKAVFAKLGQRLGVTAVAARALVVPTR